MPIHVNSSWQLMLLVTVFVLLAGFLCVKSYRRNPGKLSLALESTRFVIIGFLCFLLLQPEIIILSHPEQSPEIAILMDQSASMDTRDVVMPDKRVITRKEYISELLDKGLEEQLKGDCLIRLIPFSEELPPDDPGFFTAASDLSAPIEDVLEKSDNVRAIVLLSDGAHNAESSPISAAQKMRSRSIPLYCVPVGSSRALPDLSITDVQAPTYGIVGEMVQIPFTVKNTFNRDIRTNITLKSGADGSRKSMALRLPALGEVSDSILWRVPDKKNAQLELEIPLHPDELITDNNKVEFAISGREEAIKVLMIESLPRWEYRFIRNALYRDPGVQINTLLIHPQLNNPGEGPGYITRFPESLEDLSGYDVVFIGDIGLGEKGISRNQASLLKGLVENQASGIVFLPGSMGKQLELLDSELSDLLPVVYDVKNPQGFLSPEVMKLALTVKGRSSLLTLLADNEKDNDLVWKSLPGFNWFAPVVKAKAGTQILATHATRKNANGRIPLIVTQSYGSGKVLFMGIDSAWRWRKDVEDKYHYRFWGQVARWMSYRRNIAAGEQIRLMISPERPGLGDTVTITALISDESGAPLKSGNAYIDIQAPNDAPPTRQQLKQIEESWGSYASSFKINHPGAWNVTCSSDSAPNKSVALSFIVDGVPIEKKGLPIDRDLLSEMSIITEGKVLNTDQIESLVRQVRQLSSPPPLEKRVMLWCHPATMTILLLLLTLFWIGRKLNGTI